MGKALIFVIIAGALIGLMVPGSRSSAPDARVASASPVPEVTRVPRQRNGHFYVDATVNGQLVRFLVDTGATMVALTEEDAERVGIKLDPSNYEDVARGAAGVVRGQHATIESIEIGGKRVTQVRGAVLEGADVSLLGQSYLSRIRSVEQTGDEMILR